MLELYFTPRYTILHFFVRRLIGKLDKWECDLLHLSLICHLPATTDSDSDSDMSDDCVGKLFWIEIMAP